MDPDSPEGSKGSAAYDTPYFYIGGAAQELSLDFILSPFLFSLSRFSVVVFFRLVSQVDMGDPSWLH